MRCFVSVLVLALALGSNALNQPDQKPRVLILGDETAQPYAAGVRAELRGEAVVEWRGGAHASVATALGELDTLLGKESWAVIHFSIGAEDLTAPPTVFEENLRQLVTRLQKTKAALLFANTVPGSPNGSAYSRAAEAVMRQAGVELDDIASFQQATGSGGAALAVPAAMSIRRVLRGYKLLFEENFSGKTLNEENWKYREGRRSGPGIDGENLPANVTVSDGALHIAVRQELQNGKLQNTGGGIISRSQFGYGYYESLSRPFMSGHGVHSAFWQAGGAVANNDVFEIDSYEIDSKSPLGCNNLYLHLSPKGMSVPWPSRANVPIQFLPGGWFLDSYEYTPEGVIFYDNGKEVSRADWHELTAQQAVWLTALNGVGKVDADQLPGETTFRYFRYYAKDYPGVNLLPNGNFEYNGDRIDPGSPVAWQQSGTTGAARILRGDAARDHYLLRHGLPDIYSEAVTSQQLEFLPSGTYELTAKVRSSGGQSQAELSVTGSSGQGAWGYVKSVPASRNWTEIRIPEIHVPGHSATIAIQSKSLAGQWLEVDDIEFRKPGPERRKLPFQMIGDPVWTQALSGPIHFAGDGKFYFFDRSVGLGDAITVALDMNADVPADTSPLARMPKTGHSGWAVQLTKTGGVILQIGSIADHRNVIAEHIYVPGKTLRLVCTLEKGTASIYAGGKLVSKQTNITQDALDTTAPGRMGAVDDAYLAIGDVIARNEGAKQRAVRFRGSLANVRIHNRALPAAEIAEIP